MRSIITIILLYFSLSVFSQTYYDAKTIKKEYGRISAYNANNILIYQVECDDATWLKFQDGSIKIWDDKKEFTIFSTKLTMPSWASVGDSLNKWMGECVAMSSTPSNLDTTQIDTSLIIPLQINVINSTLSEIRDKLYTTSFDTSTIDTSLYQAIQLQSILDTLTNISSNLLHIYKLDTSQVDTSLVPQKDYTYLLELLASKSYDTSTIDTSLVMPSLTQSLIDSIGKLLTYYPINTLDTSNYWLLDSIYNELKSVDTFCLTGALDVEDSIITLLKDTIDFEYNTICYRSKADSGVYQFSVVFDVKTPNIPYYMSFFDVDSLYNIYEFVNGVPIGTPPSFVTDYVPCEKWHEYLNSIDTLKDTLKALVFKAQTKRIDGTLDTLYNCKGISFNVSANATGNITFYYGDGDQDTYDVASEDLPHWENGSFVEFLGFNASGVSGVVRINMLGCNQTSDAICAKEKPIINCTTTAPIIICSGWGSLSGIWSTISGCWNTGQ